MTDTVAVTPNIGATRVPRVQRGEQREQQHRTGLGQHVPAEHQRLHLERPRCEEIGGPLKRSCGPGTARAPRPATAAQTRSRDSSGSAPPVSCCCSSLDSKRQRAFQAAATAVPRCEARGRRTSAADIGAAEDGQRIPLLLGLHAFRRRRHVARSRRRRLKTAVLRNGEPIINRKRARPSPVDAQKARFRAQLPAHAAAGHFCQNKSCPRCRRFSRP